MTDADPDAPFVDDYLLYLLAAASEAASTEFHEQVRAAGLRVPEWRIIACLVGADGAMVTQLARKALVEQSRLTKIIDQMAERGLLERRADPEDRRRVRVHLSPVGAALAERLIGRARAHETRLLDALQGSDAAALKPALTALLTHLEGTS